MTAVLPSDDDDDDDDDDEMVVVGLNMILSSQVLQVLM